MKHPRQLIMDRDQIVECHHALEMYAIRLRQQEKRGRAHEVQTYADAILSAMIDMIPAQEVTR